MNVICSLDRFFAIYTARIGISVGGPPWSALTETIGVTYHQWVFVTSQAILGTERDLLNYSIWRNRCEYFGANG